jgi:hypothetical protein
VASVVEQWSAGFAAHGACQADLDYLAALIDNPARMELQPPGIEDLTPVATSASKNPRGSATQSVNPAG